MQVLISVFVVSVKLQTEPVRGALARANAIVGETKPMDATANNAITVLRNITILRQSYRPNQGLRFGSGNRFGESLPASTSPLLNSPRATPD